MLATLALFLLSREAGPATPPRLASYATLALALLSHESAVVFILLLVACDLLTNVKRSNVEQLALNGVKGSTACPERSEGFNAYLPYAALTAAYLVAWRLAPKQPSPGLGLSADKGMSALYFLQGLTFPTAPLGTMLDTWLGLGESAVPFVAVAIITLAMAAWFMRQARLGRFFVFALWWTGVSVLPATLGLDSDYVLGSPRLFTLGSVGAAWLWSGTLAAFWILDFGFWILDTGFWIPRQWRSPDLKSKIQNLKYLLLTLTLLLPSASFVESRVAQMADGTRLIKRMSDLAARAGPDDSLLFVNLPQNAGPGKTLFPIGFLGMTLFPDYLYLPDVIHYNQGLDRRVQAVVSPELRQGWYFTYGQGVDPKGLVVRAVLARDVYLFEPATWNVRDFDAEPGLEGAFALAQQVRKQGARVYLAEGLLDHPRTFDPNRALVMPPPGQVAVYILPSGQTFSLPQGELLREAGGLRAIRFPASQIPMPQHPLSRQLGDAVRLLGYDLNVERSNVPTFQRSLDLTLYWQAIAPIPEEYTVFTHLLDPSGQVLSQADAPPAGGSYPTAAWDTGEIILDRYTLPVGRDAPGGPYTVEIGMYLPATGVRLPVFDEQGNRLPDDRVLLR